MRVGAADSCLGLLYSDASMMKAGENLFSPLMYEEVKMAFNVDSFMA